MSKQVEFDQAVIDAIQKVRQEHPGREIEVVLATKVDFVINVAWGEDESLTAETLSRAVCENTEKIAALQDWRDAAVITDLIEVRDLNTGEKLCSSEELPEGAPRLRFCPRCGEQRLEDDFGAFVEFGEYDGKSYTVEFDATGYRCGACGYSFLDTDLDENSRRDMEAATKEGSGR